MAVKEIKEKSIYVCTECGYESAKWQGRCPDCGNWNTLVEETRIIGKEKKGAPAMQREASPVMALDTVNADESVRYHTGMEDTGFPDHTSRVNFNPGINNRVIPNNDTITDISLGKYFHVIPDYRTSPYIYKCPDVRLFPDRGTITDIRRLFDSYWFRLHFIIHLQ